MTPAPVKVDDAGEGAVASQPKKGKFVNQAALSIVTQALTQVIVMSTGLIMQRIIAPEVKGPVDIVMGLSLPLIVFSNMGMSSAILYHPNRSKLSVHVIGSTTLTVAIIVGSLVSATLAFILPNYYASRHGNLIEPWHVILVLSVTPLQMATSFLNVTQLVAGRVVGFNFIQFLPTALYVTIFFSIYYILGPSRFDSQPDLFLTSMVVARVAQWVLSSVTAVFMLQNVAQFRPMIDWEFLREALRFGVRPYFRDVFQWLTLGFTLYYLEAAGFEKADLGFWSVAATAMSAVWQIPEALHMVLANRMATQAAGDRSWFTPMACRNILFCTAAVALLVGLAAELIIRFWSPKYLPAVPSIRIILCGSVIFCFFKILQTDLLARGEKNLVPILSGLTFGLLALFNILSISVLGWKSIAVSAACSSIAMAITGLVTLVHYCHVSKTPILQVCLLQREDLKLWRDLISRLTGFRRR